ncbi:hypothetical protein ACHAXT_010096 [Thalassiosira profunda]
MAGVRSMLSPEMVMGTLTGEDMWRPVAVRAEVDGTGAKADEPAIVERRQIREARMVMEVSLNAGVLIPSLAKASTPSPMRRLVLILAAAGAARGAFAFQPSARASARAELIGRATQHQHGSPRVAVSLSGSESDEDSGEPRVPFFARALQKLRKKNDDGDSDTKAGNAANEGRENAVETEAGVLRAMAERTRLEAKKMDIMLALAKIDKLEEKISHAPHLESHERDSDVQTVLSDARSLMNKLNALQHSTNDTVPLLSASGENAALSIGEPVSIETPQNETSPNEEKSLVQQVLDGDKPRLSDDRLGDAVEGFEKLPQEVKDMMARSVGMEDGSNTTAVVKKLQEENLLFEGEDDTQFSMVASTSDLEDIFIDLDFAEVNNFVRNLLPAVTRKEGVDEECIDALYTEILGKETFNPRDKPQAVPGGYLIRGESKVKTAEGKDEGDALIEALDKKISESSSLAGKIQACYILDPTPPSGEEILNEEDETPVLLITNADLSPDTQAWVKPSVSFLGLVSIATFALGSFSFNEDVLSRISDTVDAGDGSSLDWLYDLSLPLAISILGTQVAHEAGHLAVALKDGIRIGLPTLVPGFQFGLTGGLTPIESSPKNIKSLFDFAIAGPLVGFAASLLLLYTGLELTAFMETAARDQLPSVPVEILRSSALGGGVIDYLLGDGALDTPNPATDMIKLHPFAIAGFGGLVTNALSLLPIGNTDGGRISVAFFGRSFSRVVQSTAVFILVLAGFFGADNVNTLLCYAIYCQLWQKEAELPCRNEVQELDTARGFVAIGVSLIVLLTLTPLP